MTEQERSRPEADEPRTDHGHHDQAPDHGHHVHGPWCAHGHDHGHHHQAAQAPLVRATPKVGRNDPCPCGSGKKHKKCCLAA